MSQSDHGLNLAQWVRRLSYKEGDFTLASGKKSSFYVDLKMTTLHPEGIFSIAKRALEVLKQQSWFGEIEGVGGLTLGADPLATAISLEARNSGKTWPAFIVRKETKGHGTDQYVEGRGNLPERAKVLVLEDVTTTGGSALAAVERIEAIGWTCVGILTVVDRQQGATEEFKKRGLQFTSLLTLEDIKAAR